MRGFVSSRRKIRLRLVADAAGCVAVAWWRKFYAGTARPGQSDGNGLFGRARSVFALANVMDLLAHKFARLGGRGFSFATVPAGKRTGFWFRHKQSAA
jgi:hypothetical protein